MITGYRRTPGALISGLVPRSIHNPVIINNLGWTFAFQSPQVMLH